jgi:hypothetical protein
MGSRSGGSRRVARDDGRGPVVSLGERIGNIHIRTLAIVGGLTAVVLGLILSLAFLRPDPPAPADAAQAAPMATPTAAPSAPPVANEKGDPVPGPTPGSPPVAQAQAGSRFNLNGQKLLNEMRTHNPNITDDEAAKLVRIGDANIARNQPDLSADDPAIMGQIRVEFPNATDEQVATMTRCTAEYVEREIAMLTGTDPPDQGDDHGGN